MEKICKIEGCGLKKYAHDLCNRHYNYLRRTGVVDKSLRVKVRSIKKCSMNGCNNKHYCKGFCEVHYSRWRHNGIPYLIGLPKGENHKWWKGGISYYPNGSLLKRNRKQKIKESDGKCEVCKTMLINTKNIHIHHKDFSKTNHSIENLMFVCMKCHRKLHRNHTSKYIRMFGKTAKQIGEDFDVSESRVSQTFHAVGQEGLLNKLKKMQEWHKNRPINCYPKPSKYNNVEII